MDTDRRTQELATTVERRIAERRQQERILLNTHTKYCPDCNTGNNAEEGS